MVPIPTTITVTTMVPIPTTTAATTMVPIPTTTIAASSRDYADSIVTYFSIVGVLFLLSLLLGAINMLIWYVDKKRTKLKLWQLKHYVRRLDNNNGPRKRQHWSTTLSNNARKKRGSFIRPKPRKGTGVTNGAMTSMSEHVPF